MFLKKLLVIGKGHEFSASDDFSKKISFPKKEVHVVYDIKKNFQSKVTTSI